MKTFVLFWTSGEQTEVTGKDIIDAICNLNAEDWKKVLTGGKRKL